MAYKPRSLNSLIEDIETHALLLPHIQRPFVWEDEQMARLFDSLMRAYPIQTLLFWKTKDAIRARAFMTSVDRDAELSALYDKQRSAEGVLKTFVLDGQQRLQTLFAIFAGCLRSPDGQCDMDAYANVASGEQVGKDGLAHELRFSPTPLPAPYYRVRNLREGDATKTPTRIANEVGRALDQVAPLTDPDARERRQERVLENLSRLRSLLYEERWFWAEELDGVATDYPYKRVLDIFVRVNSGGTRLEPADLMFAAMKEGWDEIEESVERVVDVLNGNKLCFDKTFALKCLVVANGFGAELEPEKFTSEAGNKVLEVVSNQWTRAEATFQQLRDFIEHELQLFSDKVVRSYGSFVPLFDYLFHNPKPGERERILMRAYYYKSQLFNWYGAQTDGIINAMHQIVGKPLASFPLGEVKAYFGTSRGATVELREEHLLDMRLRYIVLNLIYVDRFRKSPFNVVYKWNEPQVDHIYPQSLLKNRLGLATHEINHIGNYRYIGATDNNRKRAELPASYFARLKESGIPIEHHLLLEHYAAEPAHRLAFDEVTYRDFRDRRLKAIFRIAANVVNAEVK